MKLEPNPRNLHEHLEAMKESGTEGLYYGGYGYAAFHFGPALQSLGWDPPRIMGTAFMFYSNKNRWGAGLEGWHGIDQLGEDGANPNYNAMRQRFEHRFGRTTGNVVVALAYDTARVAIHGIANAAMPAPLQVKEGIERIRWMPAANGGPSTYIQFGPEDRKGYKGDFLTIRELRDGSCGLVGTSGRSGPRMRTSECADGRVIDGVPEPWNGHGVLRVRPTIVVHPNG